MRAAPVVEHQLATKTATRFRDASVGAQVDFLVCDRPPEPFDNDVVAPRGLAVHADRNLGVLHGRQKGDGGERAALIGVQALGGAIPSQRFAQRRHARPRLQRHRELPREHLAAEPVNDRHLIHDPRAMGTEVLAIAPTWFGRVTASFLNREGSSWGPGVGCDVAGRR